jgi:hypothetical protein
MKYDFKKKLSIAILGILFITWLAYYVGEKIKEHQKEKMKEGLDFLGTITGGATSDKEAADAANDAIIKPITKVVDEVGDGVEKGFNEIGDEVEKGFNEAMDGITDVFSAISDFFNGITNLFEGIDYHFKCGRKTEDMGHARAFSVFWIQFECFWTSFVRFFNGQCTFYYIVDMWFGILYLLIIEIPLFLLKNIFGVDLQFIIDLIKAIVIDPLDAITKSMMNLSIKSWSDDVLKKCYLCRGDFKDGTGVHYKTFEQWSEYHKCARALIDTGSDIQINSLFNNKHTTNWFNNREVHGWGGWTFKK